MYKRQLSNGDEQSKDGSRFRGRGFIQLTGRYNYELFGYNKNPEALLDIPGSWECAFKYWHHHDIDKQILDPSTSPFPPLQISTKAINGGYNGFKDRERRYSILMDIITKESIEPPKKEETELPIPNIPKEWLYFVAGGISGWFLKSIFTPKEKKSSPK